MLKSATSLFMSNRALLPPRSSSLLKLSARADFHFPSKPQPKKDRVTKIRQLRANRALQDEIYDILYKGEVKARNAPGDLLVRGIAVSSVDTSPDISSAVVCVTVPGNSVQKRQVFAWLCENIGQIKYSLFQRLRHWKRVPHISFKLDEPDEIDIILEEYSMQHTDDSSSV